MECVLAQSTWTAFELISECTCTAATLHTSGRQLTLDTQPTAYVTVTLVSNVSQTLAASTNKGDVSLVSYLLDANGQPVRASATTMLYCSQSIDPDGSGKAARPTESSNTTSSKRLLAILVPCLVFGGIALLLIARCWYWRRRTSSSQGGSGKAGVLRRRWQQRQRRRAAQVMGEPALIDDAEEQGADASWGGASAITGTTRSSTSARVLFPMPTFASTAPLSIPPVAPPNAGPRHLSVGPLMDDAAVDGLSRPPPAYTVPSTNPPYHRQAGSTGMLSS